MPAIRQLGALSTIGLWAVLSFIGGLYASWHGNGGREFAATLTTFAFLFAVMLLFAARGVAEFLASRFGGGSGHLLGMTIILGYLIYAIGTNTFAFTRVAAVVAWVFVPLGLAASAEREASGAWQDYLTLAAIWVAVKFSPSHWLWPFPGGRLAYVFTVLLSVSVAIATFLLVRRVSGVGYNIGWGHRWWMYVLGSFALFGVIAIPLGLAMHFIHFDPRWSE